MQVQESGVRDAREQFESNQRQVERRQNIAGTSTTYLVLERQTTLVQSQATEVQAQTDLNKAISNLRKAVGTSLDANNVNIQTGNR